MIIREEEILKFEAIQKENENISDKNQFNVKF